MVAWIICDFNSSSYFTLYPEEPIRRNDATLSCTANIQSTSIDSFGALIQIDSNVTTIGGLMNISGITMGGKIGTVPILGNRLILNANDNSNNPFFS